MVFVVKTGIYSWADAGPSCSRQVCERHLCARSALGIASDDGGPSAVYQFSDRGVFPSLGHFRAFCRIAVDFRVQKPKTSCSAEAEICSTPTKVGVSLLLDGR